jgi:hypothetical protein
LFFKTAAAKWRCAAANSGKRCRPVRVWTGATGYSRDNAANRPAGTQAGNLHARIEKRIPSGRVLVNCYYKYMVNPSNGGTAKTRSKLRQARRGQRTQRGARFRKRALQGRRNVAEIVHMVEKRCSRCGVAFHCKQEARCWCANVRLESAMLAELRARYADCLCEVCLRELATDRSQDSRHVTATALAKGASRCSSLKRRPTTAKPHGKVKGARG